MSNTLQKQIQTGFQRRQLTNYIVNVIPQETMRKVPHQSSNQITLLTYVCQTCLISRQAVNITCAKHTLEAWRALRFREYGTCSVKHTEALCISYAQPMSGSCNKEEDNLYLLAFEVDSKHIMRKVCKCK